jgi:mRNA-degrading endonuclease RelE of RelBE toxin-antitoxin system
LSDGARYVFAPRARRDLRRLDPPMQRRVVEDEWRLRVGDWRVRFTRERDTGVIQVLRVLPRGRAYRD